MTKNKLNYLIVYIFCCNLFFLRNYIGLVKFKNISLAKIFFAGFIIQNIKSPTKSSRVGRLKNSVLYEVMFMSIDDVEEEAIIMLCFLLKQQIHKCKRKKQIDKCFFNKSTRVPMSIFESLYYFTLAWASLLH